MKKYLLMLAFLFMLPFILYSQNPCPGTPTVTYDGKTYNTVQIGSQCWLKENLVLGTMIQGNQNAANNALIEKYCYNNDANNCDTYGGLYTWNEAMAYSTTPGTKGICPSGWHIPLLAELKTLGTTVNISSIMAIGQGSGTNTSGFSAMFAGYRSSAGGSFLELGKGTIFWSSTQYSAKDGNYMFLSGNIQFVYDEKEYGLSVRCLKDAGTDIESDNGMAIPSEYSLSQNYPNPFNPSTTITYQLPKSSYVTLKVYDALGREVKLLVNEYQNSGIHNSSLYVPSSSIPSGIYFYQIQAGSFSETKKMILLQ